MLWEEGLRRTLLSLLAWWWQAEGDSRLWAVCEASRSSCARPAAGPGNGMWRQGVRSGPSFHVAGGILDWPVPHSNRVKFSLFLRRKHMPVISMSAAACVAPTAAVMASLPCQGGIWLWGPRAIPSCQPLPDSASGGNVRKGCGQRTGCCSIWRGRRHSRGPRQTGGSQPGQELVFSRPTHRPPRPLPSPTPASRAHCSNTRAAGAGF